MSKKPAPTATLADVLKSVERSTTRRNRARAKHAAEVAARVPGEGYEPCIVSFIDVLGFRDLLATRHAYDVRDVMLSLREFSAPNELVVKRRKKDARLMSRAFGDSVSDAVVRVRVFDTEFNDGAFFHELLDLLHVQVQCLGSGVIIRAGVAIGDAHVGLDGRGPVFGPAMVRAYEIESNEAIHPRIVVDENAYERFQADARLHKEDHDLEEEVRYVDGLLRVDEDGKRFIDYLRAGEPEFDDTACYFTFVEHHAALVRAKLAATQGRVRAKFEWLAGYHNAVVEEILAEFDNGSRSTEAFIADWECDPVPLLQVMKVQI